MNELIPIQTSRIGGQEKQTVNARELYDYLEIKTRFNDWIRRRIDEVGFVENVDYVKILDKSTYSNLSKTQGSEFFISLDMAKELAMLERNEKGKRVRLYFLACEKKLKQTQSQFAIPKSFAEALRLAADLEDRNQKLAAKVKADAPKVAFTESVISAGEEETITGASKILGISPKKFFDWLRQRGYIYAQSNQATQRTIDAGWMVVRFARFFRGDQPEQKAYAHVTGKGLYFFYQKLRNENLIGVNQRLEM